jgi:hypothetical protein
MRRILALVTTAAVLGGCGPRDNEAATEAGTEATAADANATDSGAARNPCLIVTEAEMQEVLGTAVTRQQEPTSTRCIYYTDNPVVYVDLEIDRQNASSSWDGVNRGNTMIGAARDSLVGVGDEAFFGPRDRLYVLRGNVFIAVEAGFDDQVRERARKVAELALRKVE